MAVHLLICPLHEGIDWAAWLEAFAVLGTLVVAFFLPRHDRREARKEDAQTQKAALAAIARRAKETIKYLHDYAHAGALPRAELGWLGDEAAAISTIADAVDLTSLKSDSLVAAFTEVQEAARTAKRRLKQVIENAQLGVDPLTPPADKFDDPYRRVSDALLTLEENQAANVAVVKPANPA